jgi:hypothetical protein
LFGVAWTGVILVDTAACDACKEARAHGDDEEQATRGNDPIIYKRAAVGFDFGHFAYYHPLRCL